MSDLLSLAAVTAMKDKNMAEDNWYYLTGPFYWWTLHRTASSTEAKQRIGECVTAVIRASNDTEILMDVSESTVRSHWITTLKRNPIWQEFRVCDKPLAVYRPGSQAAACRKIRWWKNQITNHQSSTRHNDFNRQLAHSEAWSRHAALCRKTTFAAWKQVKYVSKYGRWSRYSWYQFDALVSSLIHGYSILIASSLRKGHRSEWNPHPFILGTPNWLVVNTLLSAQPFKWIIWHRLPHWDGNVEMATKPTMSNIR